MHPPSLRLNPLPADIKHPAETAHRVPQPFPLHPLPRRHPQVDLPPQPGHAHPVVIVPELPAQHRFPNHPVRRLPHIPARPFRRRNPLKLAPVPGLLQDESPHPQPDALRQRQRRKTQQIQRRRKIPNAAIVKQPHLRLQPLQLRPQPQLLNQLHHIRIADEQMVIPPFQRPAAHLESRRLPAQKRRRLKHLRKMPLLGQLVGGGQARRPAANNAHAHSPTHPGPPGCGASDAAPADRIPAPALPVNRILVGATPAGRSAPAATHCATAAVPAPLC